MLQCLGCSDGTSCLKKEQMLVIGTQYVGSVLRHEDVLANYQERLLAKALLPPVADVRMSASAEPPLSLPKSPQLQPTNHVLLSTGRTLKRTRAPEDRGEAPLAPRFRPTSSEVLQVPAFIL